MGALFNISSYPPSVVTVPFLPSWTEAWNIIIISVTTAGAGLNLGSNGCDGGWRFMGAVLNISPYPPSVVTVPLLSFWTEAWMTVVNFVTTGSAGLNMGKRDRIAGGASIMVMPTI